MTSKQLKQDVAILVVAVFSALVLGTILYSVAEGWSIIDSFYFVTMTATTVGYGDLVPTTQLTKALTVIYALSIIPFVLYAFSFVAKAQMERIYKKVHHLERQQEKQEKELDAAERKLARQRAKIKEQEEELDAQQAGFRRQLKAIKNQESDLEAYEKELKAQKRQLDKEAKLNKIQAQELMEHDQELEAVEDVMEEALKN